MSEAKKLHRQAMALSHEADALKRDGAVTEAMQLFYKAAIVEKNAAELFCVTQANEPTRSILYRSASWLALDAGDYVLARQLSAQGLAGYPPPDVCHELIEVFDKSVLDYHLSTKGVVLSVGEAQLMLQGPEVRAGFTYLEPFMRTIEKLGRIAKQKAQQLLQLPFSVNTRPQFVPAVADFRPGSVAVTFKLAGVPSKHGSLPLLSPDTVLDEVMTTLDTWNRYGDEGLRECVGDDNYFDYFRSNAAALAPDGKRVTFVGITTPRGEVVIDRPRQKGNTEPQATTERPFVVNGDGSITLTGKLIEASTENESIRVVPIAGNKWNIEVSDGLVELVRDYFGKIVTVTGPRRSGRNCLTLREIILIEQE